MNANCEAAVDPIVPELLRSRLEAIGQEAGAAVQQTAISPIVTESKDYSVTILDADGSIVSATGLVDLHFGAVMHAVRSTIAVHGETIAEGDVFIANDPHSGGGLHPQDVVIQRPIFVDGHRVAWVALAAHMMDMGGMVPGSSAAAATECYQEALRLPPVRLVRRHEEVSDIWNILRINIRSSDLVEMDMRSLVIGGAVAEAKLVELVRDMGFAPFGQAARALIAGTEKVLRERIALIEDGEYRSVAWVEYGETVLRMPCRLTITGDRLIFDLTEAPAQVPHFFNSKEYIIRAAIGPRVHAMLAPGVPFNQAVLDIIEILSKPGTVVNCTVPAPIAAAHTDATMAVSAAASECLQIAINASPDAFGRQFITAAALAAYGTGRWNYRDAAGLPRVYTLIDGAFSGSPAVNDRDGLDLRASKAPGGNKLEYADVEILEAAYPLLFEKRHVTTGVHGYGRFRSGMGLEESFQAHGTDSLVGNMTGTRAWFPTGGSAGGMPGATVRFSVRRANGQVDPVGIHAVGVALARGDAFQMSCASGGGFGDPLDRDTAGIRRDLDDARLDPAIASEVYGIVFATGNEIDLVATKRERERVRRDRLDRAVPAARPVDLRTIERADSKEPEYPLYSGVIQRGQLAVSERSGAVLAVAPGNWLDGCPTMDVPIAQRAVTVVGRYHLDPLTGRALYVDVIRPEDGPSIELRPDRWMHASTTIEHA